MAFTGQHWTEKPIYIYLTISSSGATRVANSITTTSRYDVTVSLEQGVFPSTKLKSLLLIGKIYATQACTRVVCARPLLSYCFTFLSFLFIVKINSAATTTVPRASSFPPSRHAHAPRAHHHDENLQYLFSILPSFFSSLHFYSIVLRLHEQDIREKESEREVCVQELFVFYLEVNILFTNLPAIYMSTCRVPMK